MPWAMSAPTAASAVVIGVGAAIGSGLGAGGFALGVALGMVRSVQIEGHLSRPAAIELFVPPFLTSAVPHVPFRAENRGSIHSCTATGRIPAASCALATSARK